MIPLDQYTNLTEIEEDINDLVDQAPPRDKKRYREWKQNIIERMKKYNEMAGRTVWNLSYPASLKVAY